MKWFSLVLLCIAGLDGYFRRLNPAWEKTLGYTAEELTSRPYVEFVHPDDLQPTTREAEQVAGGESSVTFENRYRCKDGFYKLLKWRAAPARDDKLYAVAEDITTRRRKLDRITQQICKNGLDLLRVEVHDQLFQFR